MSFTPRPYQVEAVDKGVQFFTSQEKYNAIEILPTGSGKSVVIANVSKELQSPTLVLQPSKEILVQNFQKFISYGFRAGIYSASAGQKHIDKVTFATIGSIAKKVHLFRDFKNIIVDECHLVNSKDGMYQNFIKSLPQAKVLGLTATPYRLAAGFEGAELRFLTRTRPRIFDKVIYHIQNSTLFDAGHLAKLEYFSFNAVDRTMIQSNSNGSDFSEASMRSYFRQINMPQLIGYYGNRLLAKRKNLLVFANSIEEAMKAQRLLPGSVVLTGETPISDRDRILTQFKKNDIKCVINVGVLTTGFDYPELECVLIAKATMSLSLYYQIVGRVMRPHINKESGWVVDLGGNVNFFGKIETMKIEQNEKGLYFISNNGRQLTNVPLSKT